MTKWYNKEEIWSLVKMKHLCMYYSNNFSQSSLWHLLHNLKFQSSDESWASHVVVQFSFL